MNEIEATLSALEAELAIMLTVHDLGGIFHDMDGTPLLPGSRQSHRRNPLCLRIDRRRCVQHCHGHIIERCRKEPAEYFVGTCWAGIVEVVVPLRRAGIIVGTITAGAWRPAKPASTGSIWRVGSKATQDCYTQLRPLEPDRAERLGCILAAIGHGLIATLGRLQRPEAIQGDRRAEIMRFVAEFADRRASTRDLAKRLHLSSSRAGHLVSDLLGVPLAELLLRERLKRAKTLLHTTDHPVKEIAARCGFSDPYRFSRAFRKAEGLPPGRYRRHVAHSQ